MSELEQEVIRLRTRVMELEAQLYEARRDADARGVVARTKAQLVHKLQCENADLEVRLEDALSDVPRYNPGQQFAP